MPAARLCGVERFFRRDGGQSVVELALTLPLLVTASTMFPRLFETGLRQTLQGPTIGVPAEPWTIAYRVPSRTA